MMVYVGFSDKQVARTVPWRHSKTGQEVNIDIDEDGGLVGFEFILAESVTVEGDFSEIAESFGDPSQPTKPTRIEVKKR